MQYYIYDLEVYPNVFTFTGKFRGRPEIQVFEISFRKNQKAELLQYLNYLQNAGVYMVGYNNLGYDYPIIHDLINNPHTFTEFTAKILNDKIFNRPYHGPNPFLIRASNRSIPQIDLMKLNHFDNQAKRTSLKALQFAMRSQSVEDLPIEIRNLNSEEIDLLIKYNAHDVTETEAFLEHCIHLIEMRKELLDTGILRGDALNYSDVKIGTEYLVSKIGRGKCYIKGSEPRQSIRDQIRFDEIILPKIKYRTQEFHDVLEWFKKQVYIVGSKENDIHFKKDLGGVEFIFGVGGVHASVESKAFYSTDDMMIVDIDVAGMYPAVAIANGFAPEHLGQDFITAYRQLQIDRKQYAKGTSMNKVLKLAGNGAYGNSNNKYSPFYDPKFTFSITTNGQLQLLQLAEVLIAIPGLQLIQANTDGVTVYMPRAQHDLFKMWTVDWEQMTKLKLEEVEYTSMHVRDVNNYIAQTTEGKIKRKGAYAYHETWADYEGWWNKDYSALVVQKVTEQMLVNNQRPENIIQLMSDPFDFMLRYKTPAKAYVMMGDHKCSKTVRYYISKSGHPMKKIAEPKGQIGTYKRKNSLKDSYYNPIFSEIPPGSWDERIHTKNQNKYTIVETRIQEGWLVKECNDASKFDWSDVDFRYYLEKINKLHIGDSNERR